MFVANLKTTVQAYYTDTRFYKTEIVYFFNLVQTTTVLTIVIHPKMLSKNQNSFVFITMKVVATNQDKQSQAYYTVDT